jgi:hypothetical protein
LNKKSAQKQKSLKQQGQRLLAGCCPTNQKALRQQTKLKLKNKMTRSETGGSFLFPAFFAVFRYPRGPGIFIKNQKSSCLHVDARCLQ